LLHFVAGCVLRVTASQRDLPYGLEITGSEAQEAHAVGKTAGAIRSAGSKNEQESAERTMKKILLSMAITAGFAGSAIAADLPVKARPMAPTPMMAATNWTGCYVGAGGGYGMFVQRHRSLDPQGVPFTALEADTGGKGWFGTVQVGCDYQFSQRWVVGVFGDYDFSDIKGNLQPTAPFNGVNGVGSERMSSSWAVGARVGYLIFPGLLGYVAGGYTEARFDEVAFSNINTGLPFVPAVTMDAQTYKGWFLGTGYEYALDFLPGLFWKTEYRYAWYDAQSPAINVAGVVGGAPAAVIGYERGTKDVQKIRTELVYRFNFGGGPVVARY
jgi:outer membrane immunogenic protein